MLSAQRFVEQWRQNHAWEVMTIEGLAQMLVAYAEPLVAKARADERCNCSAIKEQKYLSDKIEELRLKHRTRDWDYNEALDDVQTLLGGNDA